MPRTREFEETEVLQKALQTFIIKGYESTSIQDVVDATGVSRQSLYNTFGDKKALYLKAFDAYCTRMKEEVHSVLEQDKPARMVLDDYRQTMKDIAASPEGCKGCLLVNAVMGNIYADPEVKARVKTMFDEHDRALADVILRGQKAGELPKKHSPMAVAQMFHACMIGVTVLARSEAPKQDMIGVIDALFEGIL